MLRKLVRVLQIYDKELACVIMEAEKSHDRLSASWRPSKIIAGVQSEPKGLRIRRTDGVSSSLRPKA